MFALSYEKRYNFKLMNLKYLNSGLINLKEVLWLKQNGLNR